MAIHTIMVDTSRLLEFSSKKADHSTRNTEEKSQQTKERAPSNTLCSKVQKSSQDSGHKASSSHHDPAMEFNACHGVTCHSAHLALLGKVSSHRQLDTSGLKQTKRKKKKRKETHASVKFQRQALTEVGGSYNQTGMFCNYSASFMVSPSPKKLKIHSFLNELEQPHV